MRSFPNFLTPYLDQAQKLANNGSILDIEFAGNTSQVLIADPGTQEKCWAFIQLDDEGNLKDSFCSCELDDESQGCVHIAAAYLYLFKNNDLSLNERSRRSLWNKLCLVFDERLGDDPKQLIEKKPALFVRSSSSGKAIVSLNGLTDDGKEKLREILLERHRQTEETSLKFSNLTAEEIELWREGRPSEQLKYDLSFWNDLAQWFMREQERGTPYQLQFGESEKGIPNSLTIHFPDIEAYFYLSEANLPFLIPALDTVKSPLKVHQEARSIHAVVYNKKEGILNIHSDSKNDTTTLKGISIGEWKYLSGDGFYIQDKKSLLSEPQLKDEQISQLLDEHAILVKEHLKDFQIHLKPHALAYSLHFDSNWNLHIVSYLFESGDLTTADSRSFGEWVFLDDDGFYKIENREFEELETIIPADEVNDFVFSHRSWLNEQAGFQTHIASVEAQLAYHLDDQNRLTFKRLVTIKEASQESKDFGAWVYIANKGFYSKVRAHTNLPVESGLAILSNQISLFIYANRAELELIPGFFSTDCPVKHADLKVDLNEDGTIGITPRYFLFEEYQGRDVRFFSDIVYVGGEGFSTLPLKCRLPEKYRHPATIEVEEVPQFLTDEIEDISHYIGEIDPRLVPPKQLKLIAHEIEPLPGQGYRLKLLYETERGAIPVPVIWFAMKNKEPLAFTYEGCLDLKNSHFAWIKQLSKQQVDRKRNTITLSTLELIRINAFEGVIPKSQQVAEVLDELIHFKFKVQPNLTGLKSHLRPYQENGLFWLWFLYQHQLSGLLCDDMGLGKTHQAMALLNAVVNFFKETGKENERHPFLIICPTSVMYHWQEKLAEFLPSLRVCTFYGTERSVENLKECDIILTSYGIWRMDNKELRKRVFEVAIFDEIQVAKNQSSIIHKCLLEVKARMRLGLTGTPIENRLRELKSLFDLVLPTYMPGDQLYRDLFVKPIERENNLEKKELLKRFIHPFVLRRKKEEVLTDLPEKTEEIAHCDLSEDQQQFYSQALFLSRQTILSQLQDTGSPIPYLHVFALLSNLKQICDHPAVFLKTPQDYKQYESGKWNLFTELLNEARESQQKVVVFSQYLGMLDIMQEYLNELGVGYASIRGATIDRGDQVRRFNQDPNCEVFLGSLQAAGLGVDLTAGSVVIHYDRWWNAARENQATDRVHRIGQTRGVQVFKLVTKGTFEERIDAIISKKGRLMEDVVSPDDHRFMKQFTREELIQLIEDLNISTIQK